MSWGGNNGMACGMVAGIGGVSGVLEVGEINALRCQERAFTVLPSIRLDGVGLEKHSRA